MICLITFSTTLDRVNVMQSLQQSGGVQIFQRVTSKLNSKTVPVLLFLPFSYISFSSFTFPVHPAGFSFCFFLAIFILLSSNNNNKQVSSFIARNSLLSNVNFWLVGFDSWPRINKLTSNIGKKFGMVISNREILSNSHIVFRDEIFKIVEKLNF